MIIIKYIYSIYIYIYTGCFNYPTYYESETGTCVETCPVGTYGNVSGTITDVTTERARRCVPRKTMR